MFNNLTLGIETSGVCSNGFGYPILTDSGNVTSTAISGYRNKNLVDLGFIQGYQPLLHYLPQAFILKIDPNSFTGPGDKINFYKSKLCGTHILFRSDKQSGKLQFFNDSNRRITYSSGIFLSRYNKLTLEEPQILVENPQIYYNQFNAVASYPLSNPEFTMFHLAYSPNLEFDEPQIPWSYSYSNSNHWLLFTSNIYLQNSGSSNMVWTPGKHIGTPDIGGSIPGYHANRLYTDKPTFFIRPSFTNVSAGPDAWSVPPTLEATPYYG